MYSTLTLIKKYIQYYTKASSGKGHGVHSPFVYQFIRQVLLAKNDQQASSAIENQRALLFCNKNKIEVWDRGAGSRQNDKIFRSVNKIAATALKPKKYGQLLHRIVAYFNPSNVIEMGTSLGITTCYIATAVNGRPVITMEGAPTVAAIAKQNFELLGLTNIKVVQGDFDITLKAVLSDIDKVGIAYVDGNHKYIPTVQYFHDLLIKSNEDSVFIFDDIHWSEEMEQAWEQIKKHPSVTVSIDLFYFGLVFFRKENKEKEHFIIRY